MGFQKWYPFETPIPRPPLVQYGPLRVCRGQIGLQKAWQMEVRKGFKINRKRGFHKNEQNVVSYTICYVSGMSTMLKNTYFGTVLGYPSGVPREVNKRTPPKHQPESSHRHLGGPKMILGSQRGPRLWQNPVKTLSWKTCPDLWGAK